jgi:hypothetical protein
VGAPSRDTRFMMRTVAASLIGVALLSCSDATAPAPSATAIVQRVTVAPEVNGDLGRLEATIAVEIHNPMSTTLHFWGCAVALERQRDDGRWDYVWSPLCTLVAPPEGTIQGDAIPAGRTLQANVVVWAYGNGTEWPSTGLSGTYRLRIHLRPAVDLSSQRVARFLQENWQATLSNEFSLLEN